MDKRTLSKIPRVGADEEMLKIAGRLGGLNHIVTAEIVTDKILMLTFYRIKELNAGKTEAEFRTFFSEDDYITQNLETEKVRWLTASFYMMNSFCLIESHWNNKTGGFDRTECIYIRSDEEKDIINKFFEPYITGHEDRFQPWGGITDFQEEVKRKRLLIKHKKETDPIDALMNTVGDYPEEFRQWVSDEAMSFSQYVFYTPIKGDKADCSCSCCGKRTVVDRKKIRLRNNEKGVCPICGKKVTYKARGKMPYRIRDERWVLYIDRTEHGFICRYFHVLREFMRDSVPKHDEYMNEYSRAFYTFKGKEPNFDSYEWAEFRQSGITRWCHDAGKISCMLSILYPGNLPEAWEHTPMKYSALEYISRNMPSESCRYEDGIKRYLEFPALEWICKMGLNNLAQYILGNGIHHTLGKINRNGTTIYEILGLNKVNTRILQEIDGDMGELRLLQVAQSIGVNFKADQLKAYYETFECNTNFLMQANRKVSLHKLVRYVEKESERYPMGERGGCWMYSYNRYYEREDPRIERKQNMAKDWLEYLSWCDALKYDTDNMFIYLPKNFKKVHDRTADEYQALQDKKAAAEKRKRDLQAKRNMENTKKALEEILKMSEGSDAFSIKGKGLVLIVPKCAEDIKAEGTALHHCVGGYVERVAKGETSIFFVRKAESPDKSYYTMEWRNNHIIQCRGSHNCDMTPEVKAFTKAFEQKMLETIKKPKEKSRRCG